jgi:hypothetical protein
MAKQCTARRRDGQRCKAQALDGERFCLFHSRDPQRARQLRQGRRAGGHEMQQRHHRVLPPNTPNLELRSPQEVSQLLADTIQQVRTGQLEAKLGTAVGYLASILLTSLEQGKVASRPVVQWIIHPPDGTPARCPSCNNGKDENGEDCPACHGSGQLDLTN